MKKKHLIPEFSSLAPLEKKRLIDYLIDQWEGEEEHMAFVIKELEDSQICLPECVHCNYNKTLRRGKFKGIQRYSCKSCGKYWMATHGTGLAGLQKKALWQNYIKAFLKGLSIRKAAQEVGICIQTSFRWRHRLLSAISCYLPQSLGGIIESADFQIPFSKKGQRKNKAIEVDSNVEEIESGSQLVSVLLSVCRGKQESLSSTIKASSLDQEHVNKATFAKILPGSVHITKDTIPYSQCSNSEVVEHLCTKSKGKARKREFIHLDTAHQNQLAFFEFLSPFRGVATKYLQNYLNWHHFKDYTQMRFDKIKQVMIASLTGKQAMDWLRDLIINDTIIIT